MIELDQGACPGDGRSALFSQYLLGLFQVAARGSGHFGIFEPKSVQRFDHFGGDDEAREPLVVRGHDVPGRFGPAVWRIMSS